MGLTKIIGATGLLSATLWIVSPTLGAGAIWLEPEPPIVERGSVRVRVLDDVGESRSVRSIARIWRLGRQSLAVAGEDGARFESRSAGLQLLAFEQGNRFGKAFVVVGRPEEGGPLHLSEVGHRLEIVPQDDPIGLTRGETTFGVQVLLDREPYASASVEAFSLQDGRRKAAAGRARTDAIGLARLELAAEGRWLLRVQNEDEAATRLSSTLLVYRRDDP